MLRRYTDAALRDAVLALTLHGEVPSNYPRLLSLYFRNRARMSRPEFEVFLQNRMHRFLTSINYNRSNNNASNRSSNSHSNRSSNSDSSRSRHQSKPSRSRSRSITSGWVAPPNNFYPTRDNRNNAITTLTLADVPYGAAMSKTNRENLVTLQDVPWDRQVYLLDDLNSNGKPRRVYELSSLTGLLNQKNPTTRRGFKASNIRRVA
ncbi:TPA: hypothetical protein ACH3X2_011426 [Trebouxia sp. C0005]